MNGHDYRKPGDGSMTATLGDGTVLTLYQCTDCGKRMVQEADFRGDVTQHRDYTADSNNE